MCRTHIIVSFCIMACLLGHAILVAEQTITDGLIATETSCSRPSTRRGHKERIGQTAKDALELCAKLSRALGKLQVEVSSLQTRLLNSVEPLLDDQPPFKKASKEQLRATLDVLESGTQKLRKQVKATKKLRAKVANDALLCS